MRDLPIVVIMSGMVPLGNDDIFLQCLVAVGLTFCLVWTSSTNLYNASQMHPPHIYNSFDV